MSTNHPPVLALNVTRDQAEAEYDKYLDANPVPASYIRRKSRGTGSHAKLHFRTTQERNEYFNELQFANSMR